MNKKLLSRLAPGLFAVVLFTACRPAATVKGNLDVIPQPQEIVLAGTLLLLLLTAALRLSTRQPMKRCIVLLIFWLLLLKK